MALPLFSETSRFGVLVWVEKAWESVGRAKQPFSGHGQLPNQTYKYDHI